MTPPNPTQRVAVLVSGGLDSAVLVGDLARQGKEVVPIYVRTSSSWDMIEQAYLQKFLAAIQRPTLKTLVELDQPMGDVYGDHWSNSGQAPDAHAPDEDFYLPGRNVILLSKSLVWCRLNNVNQLALGVLKANPFPDASAEFFSDFAKVVNQAVGGSTTIITPYSQMSKAVVVKIGRDLPLQHTFSCMSPIGERHCGRCGKCAERGRAFIAAGVPDPTDYVSREWEGTTQRAAEGRPWE